MECLQHATPELLVECDLCLPGAQSFVGKMNANLFTHVVQTKINLRARYSTQREGHLQASDSRQRLPRLQREVARNGAGR